MSRYCDECADKKSWPYTFFKALGPCELCGIRRECNNVHHSRLPKPEHKVQLSFAPIDAKDARIIQFSGPFYGGPRSKLNSMLMFEATRAYLEELAELQSNIIDTYGPQFADDSDINSDKPYCTTSCSSCRNDKNGHPPCHMGTEVSHLYYT